MLFSVLISSLLVVVGLSIFNITLKEMTISTAGRESQVAFFAANSGLECALYWDVHENAFSKPILNTSDIPCGINISISTHNISNTVFSFNITTDVDSPCVEVSVEKKTDSAVPPVETTTIRSQGKNTCVAGARKVQRGLQATLTR